MIRGLLIPALLLGLGDPTWLGGEKRVGQQEPKKAPAKALAPSLLEFSRELARLRRSADCVVRVTRRAEGEYRSAHGIHLGEGLVATNHVAGAEAGSTWTLTDAKRCKYRVLSLGSSRSFVSYFWLRDGQWHDPLPVPRRRSEDAGELGDLVLILGRGKSRLEVLRSEINPPRRSGRRGFGGGPPSRRSGSGGGRARNMWMLRETDARPGSVVLAMDGSVIGLLVRRERKPEERGSQGSEERTEGSEKPERGRPRRRREGSTSFILDPGLLLVRAKRLEKPAVASEIKLGVSFFRWGRRGSKLRVMTVMLGSPAARSGVQAGDRWVTANERSLTGFKDLEGLLRELEPGQELRISYLRGHDEQRSELVIRPD